MTAEIKPDADAKHRTSDSINPPAALSSEVPNKDGTSTTNTTMTANDNADGQSGAPAVDASGHHFTPCIHHAGNAMEESSLTN